MWEALLPEGGADCGSGCLSAPRLTGDCRAQPLSFLQPGCDHKLGANPSQSLGGPWGVGVRGACHAWSDPVPAGRLGVPEKDAVRSGCRAASQTTSGAEAAAGVPQCWEESPHHRHQLGRQGPALSVSPSLRAPSHGSRLSISREKAVHAGKQCCVLVVVVVSQLRKKTVTGWCPRVLASWNLGSL